MTLPTIYISLVLLTIVLMLRKRNWNTNYKKKLITVHLALFIFLLLDIFVVNLKGVWADRIIFTVFLLTASTTFALFNKTLKIWQKIYFGFFVFYPIIAAITFFIDRIMFVVLASPLLLALTVPEIKYSSKEFEIREIEGTIAPVQLALMQKGIMTEKYLGASNDEQITYKDITNLTIIRKVRDTTVTLVTSGNRNYEIAFYK